MRVCRATGSLTAAQRKTKGKLHEIQELYSLRCLLCVFFYFNLSSQLGLLRYVWFQQRPRFSFSIACGKEGGKDCWIIHVTDSHFLLFLTDKLLPRTDCSTIVLVSQFCLCCWWSRSPHAYLSFAPSVVEPYADTPGCSAWPDQLAVSCLTLGSSLWAPKFYYLNSNQIIMKNYNNSGFTRWKALSKAYSMHYLI